MRIDARIRVHFLDELPEAGQADQLLVVMEGLDHTSRGGYSSRGGHPSCGWAAVLQLPHAPAGAQAVAGHHSGCSCCSPRPAQAAVLTRMFQSRARGEMNFFRSVAAHLPPRETESLRQVLVSDPFVSGCFVEAG